MKPARKQHLINNFLAYLMYQWLNIILRTSVTDLKHICNLDSTWEIKADSAKQFIIPLS